MFVYAEDMMGNDFVNVITMEECKASPWRWKFVQVSPGQDDDPEVIAYNKMVNKAASTTPTKQKGKIE